MSHHDIGYKALFSHQDLVKQLLEGFIPTEISALMDFTTLQNHNGHYITPLFEEKIEDVVWSVKINYLGREFEIYLYILLEFQSTIDTTMPLRFMHYVASFYSQLLKTQAIKPNQPFPPVFPIVLYNGNSRWSAKTQLSAMIAQVPDFLKPYQPQLQYFLIDEGAYTTEELSQHNSALGGIFTLENAKTQEEMQQAIDNIVRIVRAHPEKQKLDRIITQWLKRHLQLTHFDIKLDHINSLMEEQSMLSENLKNWYEKEMQAVELRGRLEGEIKGKLEGKLEGYALLVAKLLKQRFPEEDEGRYNHILNKASAEELEQIGLQILFATSLDEALSLQH